MKIDEASINHNVIRLVDAATACVWDVPKDSDYAIREESYIRGVLDLAEELKKVLRE